MTCCVDVYPLRIGLSIACGTYVCCVSSLTAHVSRHVDNNPNDKNMLVIYMYSSSMRCSYPIQRCPDAVAFMRGQWIVIRHSIPLSLHVLKKISIFVYCQKNSRLHEQYNSKNTPTPLCSTFVPNHGGQLLQIRTKYSEYTSIYHVCAQKACIFSLLSRVPTSGRIVL